MAVIFGVDLKKYNKIFGIPEKGIHTVRIFGVGLIDIIATVLLAILITISIPKKTKLFKSFKFLKVLILTFILSIGIHRLFEVRTTVDKLLFPNAV